MSIFSRIFKSKKEETIESKYVPSGIKGQMENSENPPKEVEISINFLGSGWLAKDYDTHQNQYNTKFKHVYYSTEQDKGSLKLQLVFSGPHMSDVIRPTVKTLTKDAKDVLEDLVAYIRSKSARVKIEINITGHSRGGVIAQIIHTWLSKKISPYGIKMNKLVLADPYAGPFNRRFHQKMDNFDKNSDKKISAGHITVYTANESRFRDPAKKLSKSDIIVFTNATHDYSKYVAYFAAESEEVEGGSVYICVVNNDVLEELQDGDPKDPENLKKIFNSNQILTLLRGDEATSGDGSKRKLNDKEKFKIAKINHDNIGDILLGKKPYEDFSFKNLASEGRRKLFYKALANIDAACYSKVLTYLGNNGHESMKKEVEKRQIKITTKQESKEKQNQEDLEKEKENLRQKQEQEQEKLEQEKKKLEQEKLEQEQENLEKEKKELAQRQKELEQRQEELEQRQEKLRQREAVINRVLSVKRGGGRGRNTNLRIPKHKKTWMRK